MFRGFQRYQWVILHPWTEEEVFKDGVPTDTATFWVKVKSYKSSDGSHPYDNLTKYALSALSVSASNVVVANSLLPCHTSENKISQQHALEDAGRDPEGKAASPFQRDLLYRVSISLKRWFRKM